MDSGHLRQLKVESLRWIFSVMGAVSVYAIIACVIQAIYHPDIELLTNAAKKILVEPGSVRPEPVEALLFRTAVIVIIPCIAGFYFLCSKIQAVSALAEKKIAYLGISVVCVTFIAALVYFDFAALNPYGIGNGDAPQNARDHVAVTNFNFYFDDIFLGSYLWLYTLVVVPLIAGLFFIGIKRNNWESKRVFNMITSVVAYALAGCLVSAIILMNTYDFPYTNENKLDFGAVYYSMTQVYAGLPMLVDHFTNTYGLYPHFLNLLFHITGLDVFKFSMVMALITGLSFLLNFYFLRQMVSNRVILILGFATVVFFSYLDFMVTTIFDSIFALFPIRYIIPSVLTCLSVFYFKNPTRKIYWITGFVSATFILWNPEIGMVCFVSWTVANAYHDFYAKDGKVNTRGIFFHLLACVSTLGATFCIYELLAFAFYGSWPDIRLLFGTIFVFGKIGLGLLPMALVHPWNITALVLILGFTWSIVKWHKRQVTAKSTIILLVALIGLGYFVYFQGRSQNSNFALSSGFSLMLLIILGDELWKMVKNANVFLLNTLFIIFLFLVSFSFVEVLFNSKKIVDLVYQEEDKTREMEVEKIIEGNKDFICKNSQEHEKILVLTQRRNQSLFFDGNKRVSAHNPGLVDMFLKTDLGRLEDMLVDSSFSIFTEPASNARYPFLMRSMAIISSSYQCTGANGTMALFKKRRATIPKREFFHRTERTVFYRKYNDDHTGLMSRVSDEMGVDSININPEFSLEIFFYSVPQLYAKATLIGCIKDSSGFSIGNIINSSKYYFGINTRAAIVSVPFNKWVYCAMNVYANHLDVYMNGSLVVTHPLSQPMRRPANRIYVGNLGTYEYFIGPISEVAITNTTIDSNEVKNTWNQIREHVNP